MDWLTLDNLGTLMMLIFLQAVLGFDNLLYISIESKRVTEDQQQRVRKIGIVVAIVLRLVLLFVIIEAIKVLQSPLFEINWEGVIEAVCVTPTGETGACKGGSLDTRSSCWQVGPLSSTRRSKRSCTC